MKIKDGYILDSIGEQKIAVALDLSEDKFSGMIKLNRVGAFLWEQIAQETDEESLIRAVTEKYDVDSETAKKDINIFLETLEANGILER